MKVVVTGAAGRLGSETSRHLAAAGFDLVITDQVYRAALPGRLHVANLLDRTVAYALLEGADALVHLANHPSQWQGIAQIVFNENMCMNMNVIQAATELGVKRVIFASSVQAFSGDRTASDLDSKPCHLPYLPLDSQVPAAATNYYGLSKQCTEAVLDSYVHQGAFSAVAVRFPMLVHHGQRRFSSRDPDNLWPHTRVDEAFSYLSFPDAARLIIAILGADLPGYRVYVPANPDNTLGLSPAETIRRFYPKVPLKRPIDDLDSLVDLRALRDEAGWSPQDVGLIQALT
jgi:nucleoside-diphosphate-sugar epimerase